MTKNVTTRTELQQTSLRPPLVSPNVVLFCCCLRLVLQNVDPNVFDSQKYDSVIDQSYLLLFSLLMYSVRLVNPFYDCVGELGNG